MLVANCVCVCCLVLSRDMVQQVAAVLRKNFFVILAGKTNGAHTAFVKKLKGVGQTEVNSPEESDYLLVFCPVASRVGTDVSEALDKIPGDKPTVLVVLHHTFSPEHVVAESRRLVNNQNVLTVDCLFYEGKLLECNRNDIALFEVQKFLGVPASQDSIWRNCCDWARNHWKPVVFSISVAAVSLGAVLVTVYLVEESSK